MAALNPFLAGCHAAELHADAGRRHTPRRGGPDPAVHQWGSFGIVSPRRERAGEDKQPHSAPLVEAAS